MICDALAGFNKKDTQAMIKMRICYLAVLASVFSSNLPAAEAKPNVVLIVADNLEYGDVGCFGSTVNRTPNLVVLRLCVPFSRWLLIDT